MLAGKKIPDDIMDPRSGGTKTLLVSLQRRNCKKKKKKSGTKQSRFNLFFTLKMWRVGSVD